MYKSQPKPLQSPEVHQFLIGLGFVNESNTIPFPCYSCEGFPTLLFVSEPKTINGLLIYIYNLGFSNGEKSYSNKLLNFLTHESRNN